MKSVNQRARSRGSVMKNIIYVTVVLLLAGCQRPGSGDRLKVGATIYPYYDFARNISGEHADAVMIIPPGTDPHLFTPGKTDIERIAGCDILIYNGSGLEPWIPTDLESIDTSKMIILNASDLAGKRIMNLPAGKPVDEMSVNYEFPPAGIDPHIWLDFEIDSLVISAILNSICIRDRANADYYTSNAAFYRIRLNQLEIKYRETLSKDNNRTILYSGHWTFGYLAKKYRLKQYSPYRDYSSDPPATQRSIAGISLRAGNMGARYIFCEELSDLRVARAITGESGMKILLLHGCHNVTQQEFDAGIDFITIMDRNLENLIKGMRY